MVTPLPFRRILQPAQCALTGGINDDVTSCVHNDHCSDHNEPLSSHTKVVINLISQTTGKQVRSPA